jgi:hypothetical protein
VKANEIKTKRRKISAYLEIKRVKSTKHRQIIDRAVNVERVTKM